MAQWAMIHPWMTFFLLVLLLCTISGAIANVCKAVMFCRGLRQGYTPAELAEVMASKSESEDEDNKKESES